MKKIISFGLAFSILLSLILPCSFVSALKSEQAEVQSTEESFDILPFRGVEIPHEEFKIESSIQNANKKSNKKMFGDVDKNGAVEAADILRLMGNLAGNVANEEISQTYSDVNYDGSIDMLDVTTLERHVAGWESFEKLPYGADVYAGTEDFMPDILFYEPLNFEGGFAYDTLNNSQKAFYNEIVESVENMDTDYLYADLNSLSETLLCYFAVRFDHPEYFWLANDYGYTTYAPYCLVLHYNYDEQTKNRMNLEIKESLQEIVDFVGDTDYSDYEIELKIHDYLVTKITYNNSAANTGDTNLYPYAWNIYGALALDSCVCEGYAESFMLIMKMFGIKCGVSLGSIHMWNYIQLDGDFYYVDLTWDDPDNGDYIYYNLFNITHSQAESEHSFYPLYNSASLSNVKRGLFNIFMPICTATKYNYDRYGTKVLDNASTLVTDFAEEFISKSKEAYEKGLINFDVKFFVEPGCGIDASNQVQNVLNAVNIANSKLTKYSLVATTLSVNYKKTVITVSLKIN